MRSGQIIFLVLAMMPFAIKAQIQVLGTVLDENKKPLPFVTIAFESAEGVEGTFSDVNGKFQISVPPESYSLTFQMVGFESLKLEELELDQNVDLGAIYLKSNVTELEEVVVRVERSYIESDLGKKTLYVGSDLANAGSTAVEALESLPSVTTTVEGNVNIRGSENIIIYVNGRETKRDPKSLRFISADALQKIELITNPSAKYDAEGVAGIINLVYTKSRSTKLEVISSISAPLRGSLGINSSISSSKFSLFANLSERRSRFEDSENQRRISLEDSLTRYENLTFSRGKGLTRELNAGISFEPDTSFSIGLEVNYLRWDDAADQSQIGIFEYGLSSITSLDLVNDWQEIEDELSFTLSAEKELKGQQFLKFQLTMGGENEINNSGFNNAGIDVLNTPFQQSISSSDETEDQRYYQTKLDYSRPLVEDVTLEMGVVSDVFDININQNLIFFEEGMSNNQFGIEMDKSAGYLLLENKRRRVEYALGIRYEYFSSTSVNEFTDSTFTQRFDNLFPSAQLQYKFSDEHSLGINFTRRINRPSFWEVSPFLSFTDPLNLETGNPYLRPEFGYLYELTYSGNLSNSSFDFTAFRRTTRDVIQRTTTAISEDQLLLSYANIGVRHDDGVELSASIDVSEKIILEANASAYRTVFENVSQFVFFQERWNWQTRFKQRLKLGKEWTIDLVEYYRAPRYGAQSVGLAQYYANASIQKMFNQKRGSVILSVRDIFNTRIFGSEIIGEGFNVRGSFKFQTQVASLTFRYKIVD